MDERSDHSTLQVFDKYRYTLCKGQQNVKTLRRLANCQILTLPQLFQREHFRP